VSSAPGNRHATEGEGRRRRQGRQSQEEAGRQEDGQQEEGEGMTQEKIVDRDIEAALRMIEAQIKVIRDVQNYRKRGKKAWVTRRKREAVKA
jgi:hypothetical protein